MRHITLNTVHTVPGRGFTGIDIQLHPAWLEVVKLLPVDIHSLSSQLCAIVNHLAIIPIHLLP